jgi:hypothetical protein
MKSQLIALAAAALLASVSGASLAQDANPPASTTTTTTSTTTTMASGAGAAVRAACAADFAKVCPGITDRPAMRQCVTDNFASLSDGCKSAIQAMQASMQSSGASH